MTTLSATAHQGETLDALVWRVLGSAAGAGAVEEALLLNPGLADLGPLLPEGLAVTLPVTRPATVATADIIQLWD